MNSILMCKWCSLHTALDDLDLVPMGQLPTEMDILILCQRYWRARAEAAEHRVAEVEREREELAPLLLAAAEALESLHGKYGLDDQEEQLIGLLLAVYERLKEGK